MVQKCASPSGIAKDYRQSGNKGLVAQPHQLGNCHTVRAYILQILLYGEHDELLHILLIDKFGVDIKVSQLCLFAFMAAVAIGTILGGSIGDRYGRKYVIWGSILGAAPFTLALPYVNFTLTIILAIIIGLVISSAFSAILVYATELKPEDRKSTRLNSSHWS